MRRRLALAVMLALPAVPSAAEVTVRKGQGTPAPTQPVISANVESPVFQSDTRNLEAILDKEEGARVTREAKGRAAPAAAPPPVQNAAPAAAVEAQGLIDSAAMGLRVFAIRWREVFDIAFIALIALYMRRLYLLSRDQHRILSHAIRSAEYSAAAAKRAADICETLLKDQEKPNEAQHRLDL